MNMDKIIDGVSIGIVLLVVNYIIPFHIVDDTDGKIKALSNERDDLLRQIRDIERSIPQQPDYTIVIVLSVIVIGFSLIAVSIFYIHAKFYRLKKKVKRR